MKALVIGGTGPTGPFIVEGLINRGYSAMKRKEAEHPIEVVGKKLRNMMP
jgi:hypothetical protein